MSLQQITVAKCDLCGHTETATPTICGHDRMFYSLPQGWGVAAANQNVHICPNCMAKLTDKPQPTNERRGRG